jgi:hypothetical protein
MTPPGSPVAFNELLSSDTPHTITATTPMTTNTTVNQTKGASSLRRESWRAIATSLKARRRSISSNPVAEVSRGLVIDLDTV